MIIDTSSLLESLNQKKIKKLEGSKTVSLIFYEIGNAIWKKIFLHKELTKEEAIRFLKDVIDFVRKRMKVHEPKYEEVLEIATKFGITFYDACYVWLALKHNEILLTEDKKLKEKIKKYVYVKSVSEI